MWQLFLNKFKRFSNITLTFYVFKFKELTHIDSLVIYLLYKLISISYLRTLLEDRTSGCAIIEIVDPIRYQLSRRMCENTRHFYCNTLSKFCVFNIVFLDNNSDRLNSFNIEIIKNALIYKNIINRKGFCS